LVIFIVLGYFILNCILYGKKDNGMVSRLEIEATKMIWTIHEDLN
jgi:hypothetical protein